MTRIDGRTAEQIRPVKITPSYIKYAEGSCLIELGDTKIICTASVEEDKVPPFLKGTQSGWVTAEYGMLPRACETRNVRELVRQSGRSQEIQRIIGRALRAVVDLKKLGERTIWVDCDVIQADGGTRAAAITGGFVALVGALDYLRRKNIFKALPINDYLAAISVGIVGGQEMVDLSYEEDAAASVDLNVMMTGNGRIVEIQGTAEGMPFGREKLNQLIDLAEKGLRTLIQHQKELLQHILHF